MFTEEATNAVTPADGILLSKNKLSIIEQKNKTNYSLTRKELDDFTTHMSYFLFNMVQHSSSTVEFKNAIFYLNENHNMNALPCAAGNTILDERMFEAWFTECNESESYLEENINHIFNTYFSFEIKLSDKEYIIVQQQIADAIQKRNCNVDFLDKIFTPSDRVSKSERIQFNYSNEDLTHSGDFVLWQAIRGLLYFTNNNTSTNLVNKDITESTAYRLLTLFTDAPDDLAMVDFIKLLPSMWH